VKTVKKMKKALPKDENFQSHQSIAPHVSFEMLNHFYI